MNPRLKKLIERAKTVDDIKEILRDSARASHDRKTEVYSNIAHSTGLTHDEIGALASEVRHERRPGV